MLLQQAEYTPRHNSALRIVYGAKFYISTHGGRGALCPRRRPRASRWSWWLVVAGPSHSFLAARALKCVTCFSVWPCSGAVCISIALCVCVCVFQRARILNSVITSFLPSNKFTYKTRDRPCARRGKTQSEQQHFSSSECVYREVEAATTAAAAFY